MHWRRSRRRLQRAKALRLTATVAPEGREPFSERVAPMGTVT